MDTKHEIDNSRIERQTTVNPGSIKITHELLSESTENGTKREVCVVQMKLWPYNDATNIEVRELIIDLNGGSFELVSQSIEDLFHTRFNRPIALDKGNCSFSLKLFTEKLHHSYSVIGDIKVETAREKELKMTTKQYRCVEA